VELAVHKLGITTEQPTVAVQGFGNVGSITANFLHQKGYKVVAITDVKGGIYDPTGIDIPKLQAYVREHGSVEGYAPGEALDSKAVFELDVDILVPAAVANSITEHNADNVKAKIVAEGANGPVTTEADRILDAKGVYVIPGILANAGGVVVSYFEWVQDIQHLFWSEGEVTNKLTYLMSKAFDEVFHTALERGVSPRTAAMMIGVGRVAEAKKLRGLYP
jgi:glutamate dehydrogenase (NAD(P)+)